jgi:photosystem II stability/assembly factor-like uncharacterized protein
MKTLSGRALAVIALSLLLAALAAGSASAQPATGNPPPPKGLEAASASFVSAQTGWVLGTRGCSRLPCRALLEKTANGGTAWTSVPAPAVSLVPPFTGSPLSAVSTVRFENASDGWLFGPGLWATTDSGKHWTELPFRCPASVPAASAVAAASPADVALACSNQGFPQPGESVKEVFTSADGGLTFHPVGQPAEAGVVGLLAMPPAHPQVITLTATSGASYLYRSADGGKTWQSATYFDGGLGFRDLAYVSATTGYLVHWSGEPVIAYGLGLMKTANAGASWQTIKIR